MYKFVVERLAVSCPQVSNWCLDFPKDREGVSLSDLQTEGVVFQGWVLASDPSGARPFIRIDGTSRTFELNVNRPDVVAKVLSQEPDGHPRLKCGFRFRAPLEADLVVFGFRVGDSEFDFARLRVEGELKVLEGEEGWLFLDNDTNRSVDQFTGKLLLDWQNRNHWRAYLDSFTRVAAASGARHAVLIVPAKEMVLARHYPYPKGRKTPVEQVLELAKEKHRLVYQVDSFHASAERPFRLNDTHWTPWGAMLAALDVAAALGIDRGEAQALFASDIYKKQSVGGDLGNKFYPPRVSEENFLVSFNYHKYIVFDNHLPNLGRVIIIANQQAIHLAKCLIFGSSSSYSMLDYVTRIFSEVVFVHSAGNIDLEVLNHETPRYVIAQTNGRFVIRPPVVGYDLRADIADKLARLTDAERTEVLHKMAQWRAKTEPERVGFYLEMVERVTGAG